MHQVYALTKLKQNWPAKQNHFLDEHTYVFTHPESLTGLNEYVAVASISQDNYYLIDLPNITEYPGNLLKSETQLLLQVLVKYGYTHQCVCLYI